MYCGILFWFASTIKCMNKLPKKNSLYKIAIYLFFICFLNILKAQTTDTASLHLKEVQILDFKEQAIQSSKKIMKIDSSILKIYSNNSLAELLSNQSSLHIKTYGNGNIATSSLRGGNANHTAVLWNGLSIQNPMLGQTDLSLIQTNIFDDLSIEHGGGSAAWGSGAVGGSIHLKNTAKFNEGLKTKIQSSYGSFENKKLNSSILYSLNRVSSHTRFYFNRSANNYAYTDSSTRENRIQKTNHSDYQNKGFMQEVSFLLNPKNTLQARLWYNKTERNIPNFTNQISKKNQLDQSVRFNVDWEFKTKKLNSTMRVAYFKDILNYNDSISNVYSKNLVNTFIAENNNDYKLKNSTIHFGINNTSYQTDTKNYDTIQKLNKIAVFVGYKIQLLHSKLNYSVFLRKEFTNQINIPYTGNSGLFYHVNKNFSLKVNGSKSFRQPSLNDLYWNPGGNANLKPEESQEIESGLEVTFKIKKIQLNLEGNYFNRQTQNWIIWLPSENSYWSPRNVMKVHSRGAETRTQISYRPKNKLVMALDVNTSYVLSTNSKTISDNDLSKNKQIIYNPRYSGYLTYLIQYKNMAFIYNFNYTGYRFTSTDNNTWLLPYQISSLKISSHYAFNKMELTVFGGCNNLFNVNYQIVSNAPMPLRNYEIGISIQYSKKNKS